MKFAPCEGLCNQVEGRCQGCGRSIEEIRATLALTNQVAEFMADWGYDNPDEFLQNLTRKAHKKLARIQAAKQVNNQT